MSRIYHDIGRTSFFCDDHTRNDCPICGKDKRIAELEALDKDRIAQIKGMGKYTISIEEQLAELREQIQVLEMKVKGRNPDGTIIPATPFHQKEEGNE